MALIAAGTPTAVPLPAGFRLQFSVPVTGAAVVTLPGATISEALTDGEGLGPYQADAMVSVTLSAPGSCWTVRRDGPAAIIQAAHLPQVPYMPGALVLIGDSADGPSVPAMWQGSGYAQTYVQADRLPGQTKIVAVTGQVVAGPCTVGQIRCTAGAAVTLTLRDVVTQTVAATNATAPVIFDVTMSAGDVIRLGASAAFGLHATVGGTGPSFELEF